jgi:hypothetical protein
MTYANSAGFKKYAKSLQETTNLAMVTEHPDIETKCEDLAKPLLTLFILTRNGDVTPEKTEEILYSMLREYFGRFYPQPAKLSSFYKVKNPEALSKISMKPLFGELTAKYGKDPHLHFQSLQVFRDALLSEIMSNKTNCQCDFEVEFDPTLFTNPRHKWSLNVWDSLFKFFTKKEIKKGTVEIFLNHAKYTNSYERNTTKVDENVEGVLAAIKVEKFNEKLHITQDAEFAAFWKDLEAEFKREFTKLHHHTYPVSLSQLKEHCAKMNLKINDYRHHPDTWLIRNACVCPTCPFYLKIDHSLDKHLEAHVDLFPALHKTTAILKDKPVSVIWDAIVNGTCYDHHRPVGKKVTPEMLQLQESVLPILQKIKDIYLSAA